MSKSRAARVSVLSASLATVAVMAVPFGAAHADPADDLAKAKSEVDKIAAKVSQLDEQALQAQEDLKDAKSKSAQNAKDLASVEKKVATMRDQVAKVALAQFQSGGVSPTTQVLLSGDNDDVMRAVATMSRLSDSQNKTLQKFQAAQAEATSLKSEAQANVDAVAKFAKEADQAVRESKSQQQAAQRIVDSLSAAQREALERQQAADESASERAADEATASPASHTSNSSHSSHAQNTPAANDDSGDQGQPGSGRAAEAIAFAKAQKGKPYVHGGTGPGSFDCSGLTSKAWAAAGVSIPRTSRAQSTFGTPVSRSELKPGDLVFYYSPVSHVAMYVGNGQIIQASRPGRPVGYASVDSMPYSGARRVG